METRLCNIFQTANAITLVKTFQKALIKFSKVHEKGLFLKNPNNFRNPFSFEVTFDV